MRGEFKALGVHWGLLHDSLKEMNALQRFLLWRAAPMSDSGYVSSQLKLLDISFELHWGHREGESSQLCVCAAWWWRGNQTRYINKITTGNVIMLEGVRLWSSVNYKLEWRKPDFLTTPKSIPKPKKGLKCLLFFIISSLFSWLINKSCNFPEHEGDIFKFLVLSDQVSRIQRVNKTENRQFVLTTWKVERANVWLHFLFN